MTKEFQQGESIYNIDNGDCYRFVALSSIDPLIAICEYVFIVAGATGSHNVECNVRYVDFDKLSHTAPTKLEKDKLKLDNIKEKVYSQKKIDSEGTQTFTKRKQHG